MACQGVQEPELQAGIYSGKREQRKRNRGTAPYNVILYRGPKIYK